MRVGSNGFNYIPGNLNSRRSRLQTLGVRELACSIEQTYRVIPAAETVAGACKYRKNLTGNKTGSLPQSLLRDDNGQNRLRPARTL